MSIKEVKTLEQVISTQATPEVAALVRAASKGVLAIAQAMRSSEELLGYSANQNVQGETQASLDIYADKVMTDVFFESGVVASLVSEEQPDVVLGGNPKAAFAVAHDPLDGSSNIPFNIPVGTIFSAFSRPDSTKAPCKEDYFQPGRKIACAGYSVYGLRTQFVVSWGKGVVDCVLDPRSGEFVVRNPQLIAHDNGSIFSVNEGNSDGWQPELVKFIAELKREGGFSGRYVGSLVSDFDRNLRKGGIYLYPADRKNLRGKLRMLYECLPLAFVAEQSGAASFDGERSILDIVPSAIHERCPLYLGSKQLIARLQTTVAGGASR